MELVNLELGTETHSVIKPTVFFENLSRTPRVSGLKPQLHPCKLVTLEKWVCLSFPIWKTELLFLV